MNSSIKSILVAAGYISGRVLGLKQKKLEEISAKTINITAPGSIGAINPLIKDSHLRRIRGASSYGAEQVIKDDLCRKVFDFKEVNGYWLKDVTLLDGSLYTTRYRHELRDIYQRSRLGMNIKFDVMEIHEAGLVSTCAGSTLS